MEDGSTHELRGGEERREERKEVENDLSPSRISGMRRKGEGSQSYVVQVGSRVTHIAVGVSCSRVEESKGLSGAPPDRVPLYSYASPVMRPFYLEVCFLLFTLPRIVVGALPSLPSSESRDTKDKEES